MGLAPRFWPACRSRPGPRPRQPRTSRSFRLGPAQHRAAPGLPPRACPRRAAPRARPRQATPTAWPPRAVAGLTPLLAGERLKAAPACHSTRPRPLFFLSRALEPPRKAAAVPLLRRARAPSPLPRFSLRLARDSIIIIIWSSSISPLSRRVKVGAVFLLLRSGAPFPPASELCSPWTTTTGALSLLPLPSLGFPE